MGWLVGVSGVDFHIFICFLDQGNMMGIRRLVVVVVDSFLRLWLRGGPPWRREKVTGAEVNNIPNNIFPINLISLSTLCTSISTYLFPPPPPQNQPNWKLLLPPSPLNHSEILHPSSHKHTHTFEHHITNLQTIPIHTHTFLTLLSPHCSTSSSIQIKWTTLHI